MHVIVNTCPLQQACIRDLGKPQYVSTEHKRKPRCCMQQVNPHKRLRHQYGGRMMGQYRGVGLGELSPHVYAIAEQVGRSRQQCLLVIEDISSKLHDSQLNLILVTEYISSIRLTAATDV